MFKRVTLTTIAISTLWTGHAFAENYQDKAPEIIPTATNNQKVLVDNTHGQTAGAADWVIDGAFSDFGQGMAARGYYVKELRKNTAFTLDDLNGYDVFVIPEANIPFKKSEQDALLTYVKQGGSVFFIADHYNADRNLNRYDSSEVFNGYRRGAFEDPLKGMTAEEAASEKMQGVESSDWLSAHFGVRFRYNALNNISADHIVRGKESLGITEGVNSVAMHAGSTIAITKPNIAKGLVYLPDGLTDQDKWGPAVDQGVYFGGGVDEGAYVAVSKVGKGKAAFIGDSSMVEDASPKYLREDSGSKKKTYDGYKEEDDSKLLMNIVSWLSKDESYTNFKKIGVALDKVSPMLPFEKPAKSIEPQSEPWSQPAVGYKWYDESTFKKGSYGGATIIAPPSTSSGQYDFITPDITNGSPFQVTLKLTGLTPNTTYSDLRVGIYNASGTQLGSFLVDGAWSPVGYSTPFSVTTDAEGKAVKVIESKTTTGITGAANIRLKKGSSNLYTEAIVNK